MNPSLLLPPGTPQSMPGSVPGGGVSMPMLPAMPPGGPGSHPPLPGLGGPQPPGLLPPGAIPGAGPMPGFMPPGAPKPPEYVAVTQEDGSVLLHVKNPDGSLGPAKKIIMMGSKSSGQPPA